MADVTSRATKNGPYLQVNAGEISRLLIDDGRERTRVELSRR